MEWWEIRKQWNWWRHNHGSPFWVAVWVTTKQSIFYPFKMGYYRVWIKCSNLNQKYNRFCKMYKLRKREKMHWLD